MIIYTRFQISGLNLYLNKFLIGLQIYSLNQANILNRQSKIFNQELRKTPFPFWLGKKN